MSTAAPVLEPTSGGPMIGTDRRAILLATLINMIDGFDILAAAFTAPAISQEWALGPRDTGLLLSAGLGGMTLGALFLPSLADRRGRKSAVLVFLVVITVGMVATAASHDLSMLVAARVLTGAGVGAMMATINTVVAEATTIKRRDLAICIQGAGFPLGGTIGGVCAWLIGVGSWRWIFVLGGCFSLLLIPAVAAGLRQPTNLPLGDRPHEQGHSGGAVRSRGRKRSRMIELNSRAKASQSTLLICSSFFLLMFSFYFLTSWTPKMLTDNGLSLSAGVSSAILVNGGGVIGDLIFSGCMTRWRADRLGPLCMIACFAAALLLAFVPLRLALLLPVAFGLGVLLFGSILSLYALVPRLYPTAKRATGTGIALGVGRVGATLGPYVGGVLVAAGWNRQEYLVVMSIPLLLSAYVARKLAFAARSQTSLIEVSGGDR